jgi:hypothetical protein
VANDNAHGHETTSTANVTISAREASICHQISAIPAATTGSVPTNQPATLSASLPMRGLGCGAIDEAR